MDTNTAMIKFSELIEKKINKRNQHAQATPRNDNLVAFFDEEITIMEGVEQFIADLILSHSLTTHKEKAISFKKGVQAGIMEARTGRPHPEHLF